MPEATDDLRERALLMLDLSEERLSELGARPGASRYTTQIALAREQGRNDALRELLGRDNRDDEMEAMKDARDNM